MEPASVRTLLIPAFKKPLIEMAERLDRQIAGLATYAGRLAIALPRPSDRSEPCRLPNELDDANVRVGTQK
ncbi:MAG: hypothetical protein MI920_03225 [Kiloniellales bacterium]|nr:hypothetical protein [Kiloniellales bacterium]